jgi:threonine dehydratase
MHTVTETEILRAIVRLLECEKTVVEGAGAVGLAYMLRRPAELRGQKVCICCTGGNIDMNVVARLIERGLASQDRLLKVTVELDDSPGALGRLIAVLSDNGANILEITHNRHFAPLDVTKVPVTVVMETRDGEQIAKIHSSLGQAGWATWGLGEAASS